MKTTNNTDSNQIKTQKQKEKVMTYEEKVKLSRYLNEGKSQEDFNKVEKTLGWLISVPLIIISSIYLSAFYSVALAKYYVMAKREVGRIKREGTSK